MNWIQWVTFGIAVVGATLGIFNAYWSVRRDSVRLRVQYVTLYVPGLDIWTSGVEVINTGYIPVTLTEVGMKRGRFAKRRAVIPVDYFQRVTLPLRMEPRTNVSIAAAPSENGRFDRGGYTHVHAATACSAVVHRRIRGKR